MKLDGNFKHISVGPIGVYAIDLGNNLYYRDGVTLENSFGSNWVKLEGKFKQISSENMEFGLLTLQIMYFIEKELHQKINLGIIGLK